jgi:F-type H+-transporting ATPase subunit epsilon
METSASSSKLVQCVVVTPERTVLDATVDFVALPMFDGELGVLPGRAALIGRLGPGELRTKKGHDVKRFFVDGGFAQVRGNVVTVLTPRAMPGSEIDPQTATRTIESPPAGSAEGKLKAQQRARIQLQIKKRMDAEANPLQVRETPH